MFWTVVFASLAAGLLIGLTGIGGVVVVPVLTEFAGMPVERAIATSMLGFLLSGSVGAWLHLRRAKLDWRPLFGLGLAAAAGSLLGAATLGWLPQTAVRLFVALLALASGLHALIQSAGAKYEGRLPSYEGHLPSSSTLSFLGLLVGYGSAISGTGGPVMLIPILLALRTPVSAAVALGLAIQLPVVLPATVVNAVQGRIDYALGALIGALIVVGTLAGVWQSGRLSRRSLTAAVALTLIGIGAWYGHATLAA